MGEVLPGKYLLHVGGKQFLAGKDDRKADLAFLC